MPYVRRDSAGRVVALLGEAAPDAQETLSVGHPDVIAFLGGSGDVALFNSIDIDFVRVTEDLIYALIDKGVLQFTDLPPDAQRKLSERASFRNLKLKNPLNL